MSDNFRRHNHIRIIPKLKLKTQSKNFIERIRNEISKRAVGPFLHGNLVGYSNLPYEEGRIYLILKIIQQKLFLSFNRK